LIRNPQRFCGTYQTPSLNRRLAVVATREEYR